MSTPNGDGQTVHGVFVAVDALGVWLRGASGVGKSELALELVSRGHRLVADDAIEFCRVGAEVIGRAPPMLVGFIEIRGLGILNLRRLQGEACILDACRLDLVVVLDQQTEIDAEERLIGRRTQTPMLGLDVAQVSLARRAGHSLAVLVETAVRDHRLRATGYDASAELVARQSQRLAAAGTGG